MLYPVAYKRRTLDEEPLALPQLPTKTAYSVSLVTILSRLTDTGADPVAMLSEVTCVENKIGATPLHIRCHGRDTSGQHSDHASDEVVGWRIQV